MIFHLLKWFDHRAYSRPNQQLRRDARLECINRLLLVRSPFPKSSLCLIAHHLAFSGFILSRFLLIKLLDKTEDLSVSVFCCNFASGSKLAFTDTSVAVLDSFSCVLFSTRGMYDFEVAYFPPIIFPCSITFEPLIKPIVCGLSWGDKLMFGKRIRCSFIPAVNRPYSSLI